MVPWSLGLVVGCGVRVALVARPIASTVKLVVPRSWSVMAVRVESACQVKSRPATGMSPTVVVLSSRLVWSPVMRPRVSMSMVRTRLSMAVVARWPRVLVV